MKKNYISPEVSIITLDNIDLITLSGMSTGNLKTITSKTGGNITFSSLNR